MSDEHADAKQASEVESGRAQLALSSDPPPDLWERIQEKARQGMRAMLPMADVDPGWGELREVSGRSDDAEDAGNDGDAAAADPDAV